MGLGWFVFNARLCFVSRSCKNRSSLFFRNKNVQLGIFQQSNLCLFRTHGLGQSIGQRFIHCLVNSAFVTEFNLTLLGMHVYVNGSSVHGDVKHYKGETTLGNLRLVSVVNGFGNHLVTNHTSVNEKGLPLASAFKQGRLTNITSDFNFIIFKINSEQFFRHVLAVQGANGGS